MRLALLICAILFVSACDDDTARQPADTLVDADVLEVDAPDTADTGEPPDTGPDIADTLDTSDTTDSADTTDTADAADAADTADTPDTADTVDTSDATDAEVVVPCELAPSDPAFDDHTVRAIPSPACFFEYAGPFESDPVVVKYTIVDVNRGTPAEADLRFYDNRFYQLHDEWFWFRLLNGQPIPNLASPAPVTGLSFATIADVYLAFAGKSELPLDLKWFGGAGPFAGRLYSQAFYDLAAFGGALSERFFAVGSLVHLTANPARVFPGEIWGFELEYSDVPSVAYLERVLAVLATKVPAEIAGELRWVARSAEQEAMALRLRQAGHPLGERALTYDDLVVRGAVEVYNEGIAAGVVNILGRDFSPDEVRTNQLVVLPRVPDDIPPSRAIVSAVPQTALAHVNLLAKSRGTPNAYVAGILEWGQLAEWEWRGQYLVLEASLASGVRWLPISQEAYDGYLALLTPPVRHVPQIEDLASAPLTVSLSEGGIADMAALVPLAGGKSAGFLSFLEVPSMHTPEAPLAITIKPFVEHQEEFLPLLEEMVVHPDFVADARVRYLVLEGEEAFLALSSDPVALAFVEAFGIDHAGDVLGEIAARGGARQMFVDKPMRYETLRDLRQALEQRFAFLSRKQGLRFRSSSTAEDVPGFNGAGLYVSNTGFLYPSELADPGDRARTVERAIKQTWASYWGYQAFEERRAGRLDHFEGNMGVTVHARFDDSKERANAVATYWYSGYADPPSRRFIVNVQKGALSVTNPGGTLALPEIDEVVQVGDAPPRIVRVQASTVAEPGERLFTDDELRALFSQASAHTDAWLAELGAANPLPERARTLVLDYELKFVDDGWPALASGEVLPARIVWRQARVLDQAPRVGAGLLDPWNPSAPGLSSHLPIDLRTVTRSLIADRCDSEWADLRVYRVYTERSSAELFPFATSPFIYKVVVDFRKAPPGLTPSQNGWVLQWTRLDERRWDGTGTRVVFDAGIAAALGIDGFELSPPNPDGTFRVWRGDVEFSAACSDRDYREPYQSPADYLRGLMPPAP